MFSQILSLISYSCGMAMFLARLPIKLTLFFAAVGMMEEFWPSTHSPMLLLSVILYQYDRLFSNHAEYLSVLVRILIAMALDKIDLMNWVLTYGLAALWYYTARPELDDVTTWKVIRRRQVVTVIRVIGVHRYFWTLQTSVDYLAAERKLDKAEKDQASATITAKSVDVQQENEGEDLLWIEMDNAPPLDSDIEDPCLVPLPLSPFLMRDGIFKALRCGSMAISSNSDNIYE